MITSQVDKTGPFLITGLPQVIPVGFPFQSSADLLVLDAGASGTGRDPAQALTLGSDYTVTGGGYNAANQMQSGSITIVSTGAHSVITSDQLTIMRSGALTQETDFIPPGPGTITLLYRALDKIATLEQQINEISGRALQFEKIESLSPVLLKSARASKYQAFDANGVPIFLAGTQAAASDSTLSTVTSTGTTTARALGIRFAEIANAKDFGALGNGVTSDYTALAAALSGAYQSIYIGPGTYPIGSTGLVIPATIQSFVMHPEAVITYTGTGAAITIAENAGLLGEFVLRVKKTAADWDIATGTGLDTTSIGVKVLNVAFAKITVSVAQNFAVGLQMLSTGTGTQFNQVTVIDLLNNKVGLQLVKTGAGYVNQNQFYGGSINITSEHTVRASGTRYIDIQHGNTNTFFGTSVQNDMAEFSLRCADSGNIFINLRYEANQANAVHFAATAANNQIIGGYYTSGTYTSVVQDLGAGNCFTGAFGFDIDGDIASTYAFKVRNGITGRNFFSVARKTSANGAVVMGNSTDKNIVQCFGAVYRPQGANLSVVSNQITTGTDGNHFNVNASGATVNAIYGNNWTYGSIITLRNLTGTLTMKHNTAGAAGFKKMNLSGSVDYAMAAGGTLTLVFDDSDLWVELSRMVP